MTTALQLITGSMRLIEAVESGETPTTDEQTDALAVLNQLLESWSIQGLAVYRREFSPYVTVASQASYVIGAGEEWDGARPTAINDAYVTINGYDYGLRVLNDSEYAEEPSKTLESSIPESIYYDPAYPDGRVYVVPVPDAALTITLVHDEAFTALSSVSTVLLLPPGYERALRYALAVELAPEFGKTPSPIVISTAADSFGLLKSRNTQPQYLSFDATLTSGGCSLADFLADA
jgi:hypothetical protein